MPILPNPQSAEIQDSARVDREVNSRGQCFLPRWGGGSTGRGIFQGFACPIPEKFQVKGIH